MSDLRRKQPAYLKTVLNWVLLWAAFHFTTTLALPCNFAKHEPMTSVDTIFAVATPPGRSAIAVIRISGPQAGDAPALFAASCPAAGQFRMARLRVGDQVIDEALILFMTAPHSTV